MLRVLPRFSPPPQNFGQRGGPLPLAFLDGACGRLGAACDGVVTSSGGKKKMVPEDHSVHEDFPALGLGAGGAWRPGWGFGATPPSRERLEETGSGCVSSGTRDTR